MSEQRIFGSGSENNLRMFEYALLRDILALQAMLDRGIIETGIKRIGAEQEMFLVDRHMRPALISAEVRAMALDGRITPELAKFNLEGNITPLDFTGNCFRNMESELQEICGIVRGVSKILGAELVLTGVLPTLVLSDASPENLTNAPRYTELNRVLTELRGEPFLIHIKGLDEIHITYPNMVLEACNTSFQVHYQVSPGDFARFYNVAQVITAPVLAAAVNSPLLFRKRLWQETRLALFQHSVDERSPVHQQRFRPPRVGFGDQWIRDSVLEIIREDTARFRIIMTSETDEDPLEVLSRGEIPKLSALRLHNGTVWRWNRPCYGIIDGRPHLRIENRALPAGPSIVDEIANTAFFCGLMAAVSAHFPPVDHLMPFEAAKENFFSAARHGLKAQFTWFGGRSIPASELIRHELLPLAYQGLRDNGIDMQDAEKYLGIVEERVCSGQTGSAWILKSFADLNETFRSADVRARLITESMVENQKGGEPVHRWPSAATHSPRSLTANCRRVEQYMSTDLFTVRPDDVVDLAACIMDWEHVRHVPVEDNQGRLVGLITHRDLLHLLVSGVLSRHEPVPAFAIMKRDPITVTPETTTLEAMQTMRRLHIGCLPVVRDQHLVGIVTVYDLLALSSRLLEEALSTDP